MSSTTRNCSRSSTATPSWGREAVLDPTAFLSALRRRGVTAFTGVPCSHVASLINAVASFPEVAYVRATQEGEALAIAAGQWLAGSTACVFSQNSGLGNMVNPLTSLTHPHRIPVPLIVTWRGEPQRPDEPQHVLMGEITRDMLDLLRIGWQVLPAEADRVDATLDEGWRQMEEGGVPYAGVVRRGTFLSTTLHEPSPDRTRTECVRWPAVAQGRGPTRTAALNRILEVVPDDAAIVSTTGMTSRELFTLADRPQHFYLVGAMGSAAAVGLGAALSTSRSVVVIDGDAAALMRLGTLTAVGACQPRNLVHVVLDNGVHDSTGGQRTLAHQADLPAIAMASGYQYVHGCRSLDELGQALRAAVLGSGPAFIHLSIRPGSPASLGRPTVHPADVARRFRDFLTHAPARPSTQT